MLIRLKTKKIKSVANQKYFETTAYNLTEQPFVFVTSEDSVYVEANEIVCLENNKNEVIVTLSNGKTVKSSEDIRDIAIAVNIAKQKGKGVKEEP